MQNSSPVALGQVIANKYQVEGVLGEGGMGVVVSAWHMGLEQRVAIKLLLSHMRHSDGSALERFQREARAAARIRSEHVCRVIDTGHLEDGTPFLVMEYLEGADLADELVRRGRFEVAEAVRYLREACLALAEAHQAGVIHRDLKPANLFLVQRPDGTRMIKVLDFGVSKSISSTGAPNLTLTKTSALVGSPIYMSPEQLNSSKDVDGRTDIWALGTILYELVTGRTPFYGESIPQLVNAVLNTEPDSFSTLGIQAPAGLEQVIRRALTKSRDSRYSTAQELYKALGPYASAKAGSISGVHSQKPPAPTRSMSVQDPAARNVSTDQLEQPTSATRKNVRLALLAVFLIAAAGVAAALSRRSPSEAPLAQPAAEAAESATKPGASSPLPVEPAKAVAPAVAATANLAPVLEAAVADDAGQAATAGVNPPKLEAPLAPKPEASESRRPRERARALTQPPPPPASPSKQQPSDEYLPNFGGRR